ncbi:MAG: PHP domain-containing protein, partial [Spirochaetia bacterium]
ASGGSLTERHILFALCEKITAAYGKGTELTAFVTGKLGITLPDQIQERLAEPENPHYLYDLLGILKSTFTSKFFIPPDTEECIGVSEAVDFANMIGAIPAYAYLGDVTESPTGDKKAQKFEDDYLEELFLELENLCFRAVTYMPPRNTRDQLKRVQELCARHSLMEISGVDINSSRQSFNCPEILDPQFEHLFENTWALIAHERLNEASPSLGLFSAKSPFRSMELTERIGLYAKMGKPLSGIEEN